MAKLTSEPGSKRFKLSREDFKSIGKGFLIAFLGWFVTVGAEYFNLIDWGNHEALAVVIWSVFANIVRKFLADNSKK